MESACESSRDILEWSMPGPGVWTVLHIWDLAGGDLLLTQRRARPYERLDISEAKRLTQAQKASLRALGAIEHSPAPGIQCAL
jgi:hypothetical protein